MRYRLSGKAQLVVHLMVMPLMCLAFADTGGIAWIPLVLYGIGAFLLWFGSMPGGAGWFLGRTSGLTRALHEHGSEHGGHARRRDWDRRGRRARWALHLLALAFAVVSIVRMDAQVIWPVVLLGTSFAMGVEIGFAAFRTGDEAVLKRYRRPTGAP